MGFRDITLLTKREFFEHNFIFTVGHSAMSCTACENALKCRSQEEGSGQKV